MLQRKSKRTYTNAGLVQTSNMFNITKSISISETERQTRLSHMVKYQEI